MGLRPRLRLDLVNQKRNGAKQSDVSCDEQRRQFEECGRYTTLQRYLFNIHDELPILLHQSSALVSPIQVSGPKLLSPYFLSLSQGCINGPSLYPRFDQTKNICSFWFPHPVMLLYNYL